MPKTAAVLTAGFVLTRLPFAAIAALLVRLDFALIRPALIVLGLWKAADLLLTKAATNSGHPLD